MSCPWINDPPLNPVIGTCSCCSCVTLTPPAYNQTPVTLFCQEFLFTTFLIIVCKDLPKIFFTVILEYI